MPDPVSSLLTAAIQFKPIRKQPDKNRAALAELIRQAAKSGAELVVAPEMCTSGYIFSDPEDILPYCESRSGPSFQLFSQLACELQITLAYGWAEIEDDSAKLYNAATVLFPKNDPIFYRKRLLYDADKTWSQPGDTPYPLWRTKNNLTATLGICMDLNDERFRAHLVSSRARICAFPTNWLDQDCEVWGYWAYCLKDSQACLIAANNYGLEDDTTFRGESAILDGRQLLASAARTGDEVVLAKVLALGPQLASG